jgi:hypothetical protein
VSELLSEFWVPGKAAPKGSLNPGAGGQDRKLRESNDRVNAFRANVAAAAHKDMAARGVPGTQHGPVRVTIVALFDPPRRGNLDAPITRAVGDIDKVSRAVLDALQDPRRTVGMKREVPNSKLIADDAQVVDLVAFERFGRLHNPGTLVRVELLEPDYLRDGGRGWVEYADRLATEQVRRWAA